MVIGDGLDFTSRCFLDSGISPNFDGEINVCINEENLSKCLDYAFFSPMFSTFNHFYHLLCILFP